MKLFYLFAFVYLSNNIFSQEHSIESYKSSLNNFTYSFKSNVKDDDDWETEARSIKSLIEDADEDLKSGSGLSFEEMNKLRVIKKYLNALYVVGQSINPSNDSHFNGRSFRYVQELIPDITMKYQFTELNVDVYRLKVDNYIIFLAYQKDGYSGKKIGWKKLNEMSCGSIMGKLTVLPGVYKQFWNNSKCLNKSDFKFKITENTFVGTYAEEYFYDDKPYTE